MTARLSIINDARSLLAQNEVTSEDLSVPNLQQMINIYELNKKYLLSTVDWNFAIKWSKLTLSGLTPTNTNYKYAYYLPDDIKKLEDTYPKNLNYEIVSGNLLYCNQKRDVYLKYVFNADESHFSSTFRTALTHKLAADCAMLLTQNINIFQIWKAEADKSIKEAEYLNNIEEPSPRIGNNIMIEARYNGVR